MEEDRIKAKTKFMRMFNKLPKRARTELVFDFTGNPMTLNVCRNEIEFGTVLGQQILTVLGFEDD